MLLDPFGMLEEDIQCEYNCREKTEIQSSATMRYSHRVVLRMHCDKCQRRDIDDHIGLHPEALLRPYLIVSKNGTN